MRLSILSVALFAAAKAVAEPTTTFTSPPVLPTDVLCTSYLQHKGIYRNHGSSVCASLIDHCIESARTRQDIWSINTCVAGATCQGTVVTTGLAKCFNPALGNVNPSDFQSLDYNLYASIVGGCAWQPGGCPITQQNYIDFFYGTLSSINSNIWPDLQSEVINLWWGSIKEWTNTGDTVPYVNFNDWLHYSNSL
ncbi:hypothetical protein MPER_03240 [Moniliophthora perniciosa FA553]|nr:hypothetical protein MPER_03240 [Moniliophthora perniciosa FA553]